MGDRHVKVGLEAETRDYIAGVKAAAKATDDLGDELVELATKGAVLDGVSKNAHEASEALEDLKTDSDRAGESLQDTTVVAGLAAEAIDEVGEAARKTGRQIDALDREIDDAKRELQGLAAQFADADEASRADLTKGISALEAKIRDLNKNRSILKALVPDVKPDDFAKVGEAFVDGVVTAASSSTKLGHAGIGIAAGIAAAAAPTLGAAIAGIIVGGVGLGGIVGGVALAATDPEIQKRGKEVGKSFFAGLKDEAKDAFSGPVMDSLGDLETAAARALPKIGKFFDNLAPGVDDFVDSVINAGDAILDSFVAASGSAEEPMEALGDLVETVAGSLAEMITDLSDNADEGADAIRTLGTVIEFTMDTVTAFIEVLSWGSGIIESHIDVVQGWKYGLEDLIPGLDLTADGFEAGTTEALAYRREQEGVADATDKAVLAAARGVDATAALAEEHTAAAKAADGQRTALVELSAEMKAEADPVFALMKAQEDLADAQKKAAKAAKDHGEDSVEAKAALRDLAEAAIDLEGTAGALGETFDGKLSSGMRATLRAAGLTEKQINNVERQFREAKGAAEDFAGTYKANVSVAGLAKNTKDVRELRRQIEQLRGKTVYVNVKVSKQGEILYGGQVGAYAEGGAIEGPGTGTSDSVPIMASAGEHMWTAAEVQAAGGHQAVEQLRAAVMAGGRSSATQIMPAASAQRMVVEVQQTLDLSRADATAFGQLLLSTIRTKGAIRQELKTLVNQN